MDLRTTHTDGTVTTYLSTSQLTSATRLASKEGFPVASGHASPHKFDAILTNNTIINSASTKYSETWNKVMFLSVWLSCNKNEVFFSYFR